jgi:hypothetical protein
VPLNFLAGFVAGCSTALVCFRLLPAGDEEALVVSCLSADVKESSSDTDVATGGEVTAVLRVSLPLVFFVTGDSGISVSVETMPRLRVLGGKGLASTVCLLGSEDSSEPMVTVPPRLVLGGDNSSVLVWAITPCRLLEGTGDDSASAATLAPFFLLAGDEAISTAEVNFVPRVFLTGGEETGGSFISSFATDSTFTLPFDLSVFLVPGGDDRNCASASTTPLFLLVT